MLTIDATTLRRLQIFAAIVDQGSMTAAAAVLGITRSAVSTHLRELEDTLGVRLLERTTRRMSLTLAGEDVHRSACAMLDAGRDAMEAAEAHAGLVRGRLRVTCPVDLSQSLLLPVVRRLRARHPDLRIEALVSDERIDLIEDRVDVALRLGEPADSTAIMRRLATTEAFPVAAPSLARSLRGSDHPERLADLPRIAHSLVDTDRVTLHHPDGRARTVLWDDVVVASTTSVLMREAVRQGLGVGVLPELVVREELADGRLERVLAPWFRNRLTLYTLMPSRGPSPRRAAFHQALVEVLEETTWSTGA